MQINQYHRQNSKKPVIQACLLNFIQYRKYRFYFFQYQNHYNEPLGWNIDFWSLIHHRPWPYRPIYYVKFILVSNIYFLSKGIDKGTGPWSTLEMTILDSYGISRCFCNIYTRTENRLGVDVKNKIKSC